MTSPRYLIDPHRDFIESEGVPIVEDFGIDLMTVEVKPWARMGALGAYALTRGRGDFLDSYVLEIPPGGETEPQRHLFEEVVYVLSGRGGTTLVRPGGGCCGPGGGWR